ncbi:hypothetical protein C7U60_15655 [Mesorhizobium plurifarium]|uniref:hypothetical protein n=1 Tax=Sinorhizobium arboris TaxID=76745 RepID=UPI0003FC5FCE|nr:hypothetical protein [Sinorhizobium arboris]PST20624.1 hypothetical protein C7U60_15655 [Mesorhizobium plurifarium]
MPGATLSPWTVSYFAAACLFLVIGQCLIAAGYGYPFASVHAPETLALVHLFAIGWLGLLMVGALMQFLPVLIAAPLRGGRLALPTLLFIACGLLLLAGGFAALAGAEGFSPGMLPLGALFLLTGFGLAIAMLGLTLLSARPLPLPARFVGVGLFALLATILIGAAFAAVLSGATTADPLITLLVRGVPLHAALGLGGWLTFTAIGVSYRLLPMFMLAPEKARGTTKAVWWAGAIAVLLVAICVALIFLDANLPEMLVVLPVVLTVAAVSFCCTDLLRLFRERRRKEVELNVRASYAAFAALLASVILFLAPAVRAGAGEGAAALVYLFVFGWLTGLGLAQLYKIVPFLTWLERYGPVLGRAPVPRVKDLVNEGRASLWFCLYYGAVTAATISLFADRSSWFRLAVLAQLAATLALMVELVRARVLASVARPLRFPDGAPRPRLFLPSFGNRSNR